MAKFRMKMISIILILFFISFSLVGCTNTTTNNTRQSINDLAYVIALGLDVGENNTLKLTLQISKTNNTSSSSGGSDSSQSSDTIVHSVECSSISSGISLFNSYMGKEVNLSHCKVIVISEQLASDGISDYIYNLVNNIQIHAEANMIVCKCTAEDFLKNSTPILETLSAKYYEITDSASQYTGYTDTVTFGEFFSNYTDTFQETYAILGGINTTKTNSTNIPSNSSSDISLFKDVSSSDNIYVAGEIPTDSEQTSIDNIGIAVFNSDKIVGELNGMETICHMIVTNKLNRSFIRIPSPISADEYLDINIRVVGSPKIKVHLINDTPYITISVKINARLLSMTEDSNDLSSTNKKQIEDYINKYLEKNIKNYLYKTSKEFNSDIVGFGRYAVKYFTTWDDWISYNWNHNYRNSFFSVDINSSLRSAYLLVDS